MSINAMANLYGTDGTTPQAGLGDRYNEGGNYWIYVKAGTGGVAANSIGTLDAAFTSTAGTSTTSGSRPTAVVLHPFALAEGEYGWALEGPFFQRADGTTFDVLTNAASAVDVVMYTTGTAGKVDDGDGSGDAIQGLTLTESGAGGAGTYSCQSVTRMVTNC